MAELKRCKKCGKISSWNSYFNGYMCECGNIERKETTNADRFRAMSDEEQQKWVRGFWEIEDFADWLKQPAEEI